MTAITPLPHIDGVRPGTSGPLAAEEPRVIDAYPLRTASTASFTGTVAVRPRITAGKKARFHRILHGHGLGHGMTTFELYDQGPNLSGYGASPRREGRPCPGRHVSGDRSGDSDRTHRSPQLRRRAGLDQIHHQRRTLHDAVRHQPVRYRKVDDRPLVIPRGSRNFAFLGQYTEILEDVISTVVNSVRGAMYAVYGLLDVKKKLTGVYHAYAHPRVALDFATEAFARKPPPK